MISVTFTADNLTALRKEIAEFIGPELNPNSLEPIEIEIRSSSSGLLNGAVSGAVLTSMAHPEPPVTAPLAPAPTVEEQAPTPEETQTEQPTDSASDASPPSNDIDPDLVRQTTLRLASLKGRDAVMEVLKPYNVARSSEVPRDLWPQLIAELEAAQNG